MTTAQFYDRLYAGADPRWRELSARGKADHVEELCRRAGVRPQRIVEIGCGDGALLAELSKRFEASLTGYDVSPAAIALARSRALAHVEVFDGQRLPPGDFDLAILSHVLEHVDDPIAVLREAARSAPWVVVEVPLERNLSARRASKRAGANEIGHIQTLDRRATRALVEGAGLTIASELLDPLPRAVHVFFAKTPPQRARASAKSGFRRLVFALSPRGAERLFTLHYACVCTAPAER